MTQLFDRVPDRLFSPLASANRRTYGALLLDLYPLFFDQIHADVFPSRETVRHEIEERLAVMAVAWQEEQESDAEALPTPPTPAGEHEVTPAALAYRRLLAAGWMEEELEGYRVRVTVPPAVGTLWGSLMEVARPDRVFYGGMVLSIFNNVQKAWEEPQAQVLALRQAAREARRFIQHLNTMIYGLKGLLGDISDCDDHRRILSRFFEDFVERILVQDYKRLKTRNNPFRYRQQILQRVRELEYDQERKQALVAGYLEQTGEADAASAGRAINDDIRQLREVFERLDGHLERMDRFRARVERRVADTVRYLDRTQPGMAARFAALLRDLGPRLADLGRRGGQPPATAPHRGTPGGDAQFEGGAPAPPPAGAPPPRQPPGGPRGAGPATGPARLPGSPPHRPQTHRPLSGAPVGGPGAGRGGRHDHRRRGGLHRLHPCAPPQLPPRGRAPAAGLPDRGPRGPHR